MSIVLIGDIVSIIIFTALGFASHNTLASEGVVLRYFATFVPWLLVYLFVGHRLDVFDPALAAERATIWQAWLAMFLASPLAAVLRGLLLRRDVPPTFVIVMTAVSGLVIIAWRAIYVFWVAPR